MTKYIDLLIVLRADFKIALRMGAYRADFWSLCANKNMTAVAAFPHLDLAFFKYSSSFDIFKKCAVTLFMMLFDSCHHTEFSG